MPKNRQARPIAKDIIESVHRHDFKSCFCGRVSVDGGKDYLRRCFTESPEKDYTELTKYEQENSN